MPRRPLRRVLAGLAFLGVLQASAADAERITLPGLSPRRRRSSSTAGAFRTSTPRATRPLLRAGFNAARDRLWQIDLWRRRGLGRLADGFGPAYVEKDRAARLFLYRGDLAREWSAYAQTRRHRRRLRRRRQRLRRPRGPQPRPLPGSSASRLPPGGWKAEDVVRIRSHGLRQRHSEVAARPVPARGGVEPTRCAGARAALGTRGPQGLDPCDPAEALATTTSPPQRCSFAAREARRGASGEGPRRRRARRAARRLEQLGDRAARTATGRPILANDPHRALGVPVAALPRPPRAPGLDVIGAGEPALPGISSATTALAFGLTIFSSTRRTSTSTRPRGAARTSTATGAAGRR